MKRTKLSALLRRVLRLFLLPDNLFGVHARCMYNPCSLTGQVFDFHGGTNEFLLFSVRSGDGSLHDSSCIKSLEDGIVMYLPTHYH